MPDASATELTRLLHAASDGDTPALSALWARVYGEVREIASRKLLREGDLVNLQATLLANEAYLKVHGASAPKYENRRHFFASVARAMEQILVDHARARGALKRGGGAARVDLEIAEGELARFEDAAAWPDAPRVVGLLEELSESPKTARWAEVVRLRFVLGLSVRETAETLEISERTVKSDWAFARAWLLEQIERAEDGARGGA